MRAHRFDRCRRPRGHGAFTLLEVMLALTLFAMIAAGISAVGFQARRAAQANEQRQAVWSATEGLAEQIRGLTYAEVRRSLAEPEDEPLALLRPTGAESGPAVEPLLLYAGQANAVPVRLESGLWGRAEGSREFEIEVVPALEDLVATGMGLDCVRVVLDVSWEERFLKMPVRRTYSVRFIKLPAGS